MPSVAVLYSMHSCNQPILKFKLWFWFTFNRIAPGWYMAGSPDLAIVELNRRVEFVPNFINPICVPSTPRFNDRPKNVYTGGWGTNQFSPTICSTNDFGPNPHTMCKFPFVYGGHVHNGCSHFPTPAANNPICNQFFAWAKRKSWSRKWAKSKMPESSSFKLYFWNKKHQKTSLTTCYRQDF